LAGIREGLDATDAELAYVTGTDAPFLTTAFVEAMLSHGCAAAPEVDGFVQTLAAVYPRAAAIGIDEMLAAGDTRPLHLLKAVLYRKVAATELPDLDSVRGFNTPSEYLDAVRGLDAGATAQLELTGMLESLLEQSQFEVPIGTLAEVLGFLPASLGILDGDQIAAGFSVSLEGHGKVSSTGLPIGQGERVVVSATAPVG
jgi:hypothetical protein